MIGYFEFFRSTTRSSSPKYLYPGEYASAGKRKLHKIQYTDSVTTAVSGLHSQAVAVFRVASLMIRVYDGIGKSLAPALWQFVTVQSQPREIFLAISHNRRLAENSGLFDDSQGRRKARHQLNEAHLLPSPLKLFENSSQSCLQVFLWQAQLFIPQSLLRKVVQATTATDSQGD